MTSSVAITSRMCYVFEDLDSMYTRSKYLKTANHGYGTEIMAGKYRFKHPRETRFS